MCMVRLATFDVACYVQIAGAFVAIEVAHDGYGDLLYLQLFVMLGVG